MRQLCFLIKNKVMDVKMVFDMIKSEHDNFYSHLLLNYVIDMCSNGKSAIIYINKEEVIIQPIIVHEKETMLI